MQKSETALLKVLGWVFLIWGFAAILAAVVFLMMNSMASDSLWLTTLAGNLDLTYVSVLMGCIQVIAGVCDLRWSGKPKKAGTLIYVGTALTFLFILEAFFFYTQVQQVYWVRLVIGVLCGGLYIYGAWKEAQD